MVVMLVVQLVVLLEAHREVEVNMEAQLQVTNTVLPGVSEVQQSLITAVSMAVHSTVDQLVQREVHLIVQ